MHRLILSLFIFFALVFAPLHAQSNSPLPDAPSPQPEDGTVRNLPRNLLHDQEGIWTSPFRMSEGSAVGSLFLVAAAGALGAEDRHVMQNHFLDKKTNDHANAASTGLTGLLVAAPVALYGVGHLRSNARAQETGVLAGEAMVDSLAVNQVFKIASRRERPTLDDARGKFLQPGVGIDSSFASNHSTVAWSSAAVIASEYNGWLTKILAYGAATGVSVTRVVGRDHFPSDVFVGSATGWLIGRYVYHRHTHVDRY